MKKIFIIILSCILILLTANAQEKDNLWQLRTSDYTGKYYGTTVANGGIGILPGKEPFSIHHVILNHVFDANDHEQISRVIRGINPFGLKMQIDNEDVREGQISKWEQNIDMRQALHSTSFIFGQKVNISYSICALRNMPYCGLIQVEVEPLRDCELSVLNYVDVPNEYQNPKTKEVNININFQEGHKLKMVRTSAFSKHRNVEVSASSAFIYNDNQNVQQRYDNGNKISISLKKGQKFTFALLGSICTNREFIDPNNESDRQVIYGLKEGVNRLMAGHLDQWEDLWRSDIIIEGDDAAQRSVRFALYNLYSFAREGNRLSIPPFGLSSQGYNGHVFWDTEFWMLPPMLFLNQGIAKSMVDYRVDRLQAACQKAMSYGYRGAMFPWESDDAGEEACPTWALSGPFEHHITADIGIAAWNYYCVSKNKQWLREEGFLLIKEVADFWTSRAEKNKDGSYSIRNVVCADEYAEGVDDNAFTNSAAVCALQNACKAASICGFKAPNTWSEVARKMRIPKFEDGVTMEYEGYKGQKIKQADANLLAYPLGMISKPEDIRKDLAYYEDKIDKRGPAMSFSVFAVQYARLGDGDKAYEMFKQGYQPNQLPPFGVLAEGAGGTNPYFTTGAGGMLQAVINGFCGLEITDKGIKQLPSSLPKHWRKLTITGVGPQRKTYQRIQK